MTRRIHLATTVLTISLLVLLSSPGSAQAQGFYRRWAFCESGRCIKATGYAVFEFTDADGLTTAFTDEKSVEPAILMVDLVNRYIVLESNHISIMQAPISIYYMGFNIYIHSVVYGHIRVGLPGTAYVSFTEWRTISSTISQPPFTAVYFYGLASFYNRLEDNPMWPPPPP